MGIRLEGHGTYHHAHDSGGGYHDGHQCTEAFRYRLRYDRWQLWHQRDREPYVHRDVQKLQRWPRDGCRCGSGGRDHSLHLLQRQTLFGAGGNPMNRDRINKLLGRIPTHAIIIFTLLIWILPTLGLLITSLRPVQDVNTSGWWTVLSPKKTGGPYAQYCAACHGADGKAIPQANLTNPAVIEKYPRSLQLLAVLRKSFNGQPHMGNTPLP